MRLIALLLTMMLALSSMAQTAKPQDPKAAIRKHYAAAKAYIEQQQQVEDGGDIYPVTQCFTAQVKQNLPATGYHYEDVKKGTLSLSMQPNPTSLRERTTSYVSTSTTEN